MYKIAFTGGSGGGKTKVISSVAKKLEECGYRVFVLSETATEISRSGIRPSEIFPMAVFQQFILEQQLNKENLYEKIDIYTKAEKTILLIDRTVLDGMLYLPSNVFLKKLAQFGLDTETSLNRYDTIFHLTTIAAKDKGKYHNKDTNPHSERRETAEEAIDMDKRSKELFSAHKDFVIVGNYDTIEDKADEVYRNIMNRLD